MAVGRALRVGANLAGAQFRWHGPKGMENSVLHRGLARRDGRAMKHLAWHICAGSLMAQASYQFGTQ